MKAFIIVLSTLLVAAVAVSLTGRIIGGKDADIADFPYQVSMLKYGAIHNCGGAIISKNWIITAAHCFEDIANNSIITFRIGSSMYNNGGTIVRIAQVFKHPNFKMRTMSNDVALVMTDTEMMMSDNIKSISLPRVNELVPGGTRAIVSGWGSVNASDAETPINLKYVQITILDHDVCKERMKLYASVDDTMFCAFDEGKDTCNGDSGGPITIRNKLVGVVSWGLGCAYKNPGMYTRLSNPETRNWIKKISGI